MPLVLVWRDRVRPQGTRWDTKSTTRRAKRRHDAFSGRISEHIVRGSGVASVRAGVDGGILFIVIELRRLELRRKKIPALFQSKEFSGQYQVNPDSDST